MTDHRLKARQYQASKQRQINASKYDDASKLDARTAFMSDASDARYDSAARAEMFSSGIDEHLDNEPASSVEEARAKLMADMQSK